MKKLKKKIEEDTQEENYLKRRRQTTESAIKSSFGRPRNESNFFEGTIDDRKERERERRRIRSRDTR